MSQMLSAMVAEASQVGTVNPTICPLPNGTRAPCGPGNDQCGPPQDPNARPKFHVKDLTCDENDPNCARFSLALFRRA